MEIIIGKDEIIKFIEEIENGKSIDQVASEKQIKESLIRAFLLEYGGARGKNILLKEIEDILPISIEELTEKYNNGKTTENISNELGVNCNWLREKITKYESILGKKIPKKRKGNRRDDLDEDCIIGKYKSGLPIEKIAKESNASMTAIYRIINEYKNEAKENIDEIRAINIGKIKSGKTKTVSKSIKIQMNKDKAIELERKKVQLIEELVNKYGCSYQELSRIARNAGYEISESNYYQALNNIKRNEERN